MCFINKLYDLYKYKKRIFSKTSKTNQKITKFILIYGTNIFFLILSFIIISHVGYMKFSKLNSKLNWFEFLYFVVIFSL